MNAYITADKVGTIINEEILAPLQVELTAMSKRHIRQVIREAIPTNKWCKDDWIKETMRLQEDYPANVFRKISTIDTAIPYGLQKSLADLLINSQMFVTVYYTDEPFGSERCMDIRALFGEVDNQVRLGTV